MSTLYTINFDGFSDGTVPAGWTGYWSIYNWPDEALSGTGILVALGQSPGAFGKYSGMAARTVADYTFQQKAKFNGASLPIHAIIHSDGSNVWADTFAYRVMFTASATGVTASMAPFIDGGFPGGPSNSRSVAFATGDAITVRLKVDGKNVSCWVWNATTESMPADPLVTWTDSTQRAAGYFAIALNNENVIANPIDNLVITDGATGGTNGTATGATLTGTSSLSAGSASGGAGGSSATAPGATLTGSSSLSAGTATGGASGSFSSSPMENNAGGLLTSTTVLWEWRRGAGIGVAPTSVTYGSGTTNASGVLVLAGLPVGAGELLAATADYANVYYERGTVS